jgi:hypothetical protein
MSTSSKPEDDEALTRFNIKAVVKAGYASGSDVLYNVRSQILFSTQEADHLP